ncbi:MAG: RHS repeat-associated core domain-containing protein, partial [Pseudomonadota bacterium]
INDITQYTYHPDGTLASVTDPNGLTTQYLDYNDLGQATRMVDPAGIATTLAYDLEGQLLEVVENADQNTGHRSTFTYDLIGQMTSFTTPGGEVWTLSYNEARRLVSMEDSAGEVMEFDYDLAGNVVSTTYRQADGTAVYAETATFDELSRLRDTLGALGQQMSFTYDEEDNLASAVDALTNTASNGYDALNRVVSILDRDAGQTELAYDDANQVTALDDQRQLQTRYTYNGFGDILAEVSPDRGTMIYAYDSRGLVSSMTDARGVESFYEYDDGGRVIAWRFPSDPTQDQDFRYDYSANNSEGEGRFDRVDDESGYTHRRYQSGGYVSLDRRRITNRTYSTSYRVDNKGRIQRLQTPGRLELVYTYDRQDRVTRITAQRRVRDPQTGQFPPRRNVVYGASYMAFGDVRSYRYGDTASQTRTYDMSYRLTRQRDGLGGTFLRDVIYGWTARDNLRVASDVLDAQNTESYAYSPREFMAQATGPYGVIGYAYDAVGNRTSRTDNAAADAYSYSPSSNRLESVAFAAGGARNFTYDDAGNVLTDERDGQVYSYTYNAANRMESFSIDGVLQEEYLYNALGQQVVRRLATTGKSIHVIHDLDGNRLAEYEIDNATGEQTLLQEYIWFNGEPVAVVDGQTDEIFFVRADHIGRPIFATDASGAPVWEASYLPFGGVHVATADAIALRFPGQWFHAQSGLYQNWMRDYDPTTGRYLQADPLGLVAGATLYGYARQNPAIYIDPDGEHPLLAAAALAGLASVAFDFAFDQLFGDQCYTWEEALTAFALGAVTGGGGFAATGIKRAGREFSHSVPARTLKRSGFGRRLDKRSNSYRSLNGNYVSPKFHSWTDPSRYLKGQRKATKRMLHPAARPFARAPLWSYGAFAGMFAPSDCRCRQ